MANLSVLVRAQVYGLVSVSARKCPSYHVAIFGVSLMSIHVWDWSKAATTTCEAGNRGQFVAEKWRVRRLGMSTGGQYVQWTTSTCASRPVWRSSKPLVHITGSLDTLPTSR